MYLISQHEGQDAQKVLTSRPPMGVGLAPEKAREFARVEVHGTDFADPGEDYCEFRAFRPGEKVATAFRVNGY